MRSFRQQLLYLASVCPQDTRVIFDLDSTIFNTRYRTQKIFEEWCSMDRSQQQYPMLCEKIQAWSQSDPLLLKEIYDPIEFVSFHTDQSIASDSYLAKQMRYYWSQRFFHGSYLAWDRPYPAAVSVVVELYKLGCSISYLTARNRYHLLGGTLLSLSQHGLPLPQCGTQKDGADGAKSNDDTALFWPNMQSAVVSLHLKDKEMSRDEDYKDEALGQLKIGFDRVIYIENEPAICAMAHRHHHDIHTYLYRSVHSSQMQWSELDPHIQHQSFSSWC